VSRPSSKTFLSATLRGEVDSVGNNIAVKELLRDVENKQLLSKVAASGLLSKAQKAGIKLSSLEPLLELAASNPDILVSESNIYTSELACFGRCLDTHCARSYLVLH
jgi:hypothetical protein